ncbi:hypothetical protein [Kordiimonas sp. SCSIO 12610]|uniref:hypothetical protein n=1 Tax=Kordiimonas sp. SCSIO 12610 TaxID=2829597 RepID=UPI00210EF07D|nr:hypothetical protein [Kordiimonas sp. SCSIO 12610]UTW54211.1 hypothetical protein KFF44_10265 [Kordiimonas sp. SCSIO 12610]
MLNSVSNEGLGRLVTLELNRMHPANKEEARRALIATMGVYDDTRITIDHGIDSYFQTR